MASFGVAPFVGENVEAFSGASVAQPEVANAFVAGSEAVEPITGAASGYSGTSGGPATQSGSDALPDATPVIASGNDRTPTEPTPPSTSSNDGTPSPTSTDWFLGRSNGEFSPVGGDASPIPDDLPVSHAYDELKINTTISQPPPAERPGSPPPAVAGPAPTPYSVPDPAEAQEPQWTPAAQVSLATPSPQMSTNLGALPLTQPEAPSNLGSELPQVSTPGTPSESLWSEPAAIVATAGVIGVVTAGVVTAVTEGVLAPEAPEIAAWVTAAIENFALAGEALAPVAAAGTAVAANPAVQNFLANEAPNAGGMLSAELSMLAENPALKEATETAETEAAALFEARDFGERVAQKMVAQELEEGWPMGASIDARFGTWLDAFAKAHVRQSIREGRLPSTFMTSPNVLVNPRAEGLPKEWWAQPDVWDTATGRAWDFMRANPRAYYDHLKYVGRIATGPLDPGTLINELFPLYHMGLRR